MIELSRSSKDELFSRTRTKPEQSSGSNQIIVGGSNHIIVAYMQKTCDVAEKAILAKKNLRKKCVNRDKM